MVVTIKGKRHWLWRAVDADGYVLEAIIQSVEHRSHKGLNNRVENSHLAVRRREHNMKRFKSARQCQCFVSSHGPISNLFHAYRNHMTAADHRDFQTAARQTWRRLHRGMRQSVMAVI